MELDAFGGVMGLEFGTQYKFTVLSQSFTH
jgi:hypothetical protein